MPQEAQAPAQGTQQTLGSQPAFQAAPSLSQAASVATPRPQQPSQPQGASGQDPEAISLAQAIRYHESGGTNNPDMKGKSGEYGAYQWLPGTWDWMSKQAGVNVPLTASTLQQQNQVAYTVIKKWKDEGYGPAQIASMWNAGGGEPDAYKGMFKDGSPSKGKNKYGVYYDVPDYANAVVGLYNKFKQQPPQVPDNGPQHDEKLQAQAQSSPLSDAASTAGRILDWAFPIAGDAYHDIAGGNKKTALQQLGDLGLSALWFAPGVGEGASAAIRGAGLLGETGAKIAGRALGGAALGYSGDVASNLAQGQTDAGQIFTPGIGTATGGLLGGAIGKLGARYGGKGVLKAVEDNNNDIFGQWKKTAGKLDRSFVKDSNPGKLAAMKGVHIGSMYDPATLSYDTAAKGREVAQTGGALNDVLSAALQKTAGGMNINSAKQGALDEIVKNTDNTIQANRLAKYVHDLFGEAAAAYGDNANLTLKQLNDMKGVAWKDGMFDAPRTNEERQAARMVGHYLKGQVEDIAQQNGLKGVRTMNKYIGTHFDLADLLEQKGIHGLKTKGGRLGDVLTRRAGDVIGGTVGAMFGGPVGSILGIMAGDWGGGKAASLRRYISAGPIRNALLNHMTEQDPQIVQKLVDYVKTTQKGQEAIKELAGRAAVKTPSQGSGMLGNLITKGAVRAATPGAQ